jgi:succinoglycan biosynthesis transport protein ExoP
MAVTTAIERDDVSERLRALWRRRLLVAAVAGGAAFAVLALALLWPPTYQSSATILIEQQEIPQDLVRSTITSFADQRVQVISQRVMTTQNLLQIVDRYNLYPSLRQSRPREVLLKRMRDDVRMAMISADVIDPRSGRPTRANIAFSVAYDSRSPELAYKVASELTTLYLNENVTSRAREAEQASSFLKEEAGRLSAQITELDARIADFKKLHGDRLPELTQLNLTVMDRTDTELRDVQSRLGSIGQQRLLLEAQLAQLNPSSSMFSDSGVRILSPEDRLRTLRSQLASLSARYAADHPDVVAAQREIEGLEQQVASGVDANDLRRQLDDARGRLAAARERYAPEHPDVRRLERRVSSLEQSLAGAPAVAAPPPAKPDNPAYIQVRGQLDALLAERDTLERKQAGLRDKLASYESRVARAPDVERDYHQLLRDADNARAKYQEIRSKQMEAQVSQNLETERRGERFTLIEPPLPPEEPISPNRTLILVLGLLLSVAAGVGAGWLRELAAAAVRGPGDLRRLAEVPALALVPLIVTAADRAAQRRFARRALAGSALAMLLTVVFIHLFVVPLDVAWFALQRRLGI